MKQLVKLLPCVYLDPADVISVRVVGKNVYVNLHDAELLLQLTDVTDSADTLAETLVSRINAVLAERHHGV
ncbi:hypothetical protein AAH678_06625 [Sodalis endosymbiont of Spalangia cameroni]|uniref:hypothetical protein n=1 Tax=Sodalis praecaptivus TaxID=1239307 RepID=UPI0031F7395A